MLIREFYLKKIRDFYDVNSLIKILCGLRRSGKSVILKQIIDEIKEKGIDDAHIIYINFESLDYADITTAIELNNYIIEGGFPRTIFFDEIADKRNYVANIVDEIFEKDIRRRVKIKNRELFNDVTRYMINNFAATTNIRSLHTILVKSGFVISEATVDKYVNTLVDAKILYECNRFDMKSKRSIRGDRKYYLSDLSFYFSMNTDNQLNYGPSLENIVYIYSKSKGYSVSIGRIGKLECDFILRDSELNYSYVQVSYTIALSKETEDREYRPLEQIKNNYPKYVATTDYILQRRNGIKHVNILEFMLNNQDF